MEKLALVDCAEVTGGFDDAGAMRTTHLWIAGASKLALRGLKPLAGAASVVALHLDGVAPRTLFRWLAPMTWLACLDLSRPAGDPELGRALAPLVALRALVHLGLRGAHLSDAALRSVAALPSLRRLDLSGAAFTARPATWKKLRALRELRLVGARNVTSVLRSLEQLDGLTLLDLRGQRVHPGELARLRAALPGAHIAVDAALAATARSTIAVAAVGVPTHRPSPPPPPPLPANPLSWPKDAPPVASLYVVMPDERGQPCGFDQRYDIGELTSRFLPREVITGLDADAHLDACVTGLTILPTLIRRADPHAAYLTDNAITAVRALLGRTESVSWQWGPSVQQRYAFVVGGLAAAALSTLLAWRAQHRGVALGDDLPHLKHLLDAELARDGGTPWIVSDHLLGRQRDAGFGDAVSAFFRWLADVMHDPAGLPRARVGAMERLDRDRERMPASVQPLVDEVWQRALVRLAQEAAAPTTEMHFRRAARRLVAERAPALLDRMRGEGALPSRALPPYARVVGGLGTPDALRVLALAPDIDGATCLAALRGSELALWFSALAFAPHCGDDDEAQALACTAADVVGRAEVIPLVDAPCRESASLGELAGAALASLVVKRGVPRGGLIERVLVALRGVPLSANLTTPPGALAAIGALAQPAENGTPALVRARFLDRSAPAAERFMLLLLCFALRRDHAQRVVEDDSEDGDLRALVGCLSGLTVAPDAGLPICEPASRVPLACLQASLALGHHPVSVRRATQALVSRVLPWEASGAELAHAVEQLRAMTAPVDSLRLITDEPGFGRGAAARWLAALGDGEDEERIARVMVEEGGWTATRPQGRAAPQTGIERLMSALVNETVVDHCDSDFDELLQLGFGAERALRVRAKAYALIAKRHADAGRLPFARRSAAFAASLDGLNLDVVRLRKALGRVME
ncbi:MAG: hypothetical protein A2138_15640 [Deltaproteobacteria bacterium RBG_16_71_12]|nr:MAG: hypothetical protein A2138_15640 [Deltaproteobacteria bacterium RBG_16_71_12]